MTCQGAKKAGEETEKRRLVGRAAERLLDRESRWSGPDDVQGEERLVGIGVVAMCEVGIARWRGCCFDGGERCLGQVRFHDCLVHPDEPFLFYSFALSSAVLFTNAGDAGESRHQDVVVGPHGEMSPSVLAWSSKGQSTCFGGYWARCEYPMCWGEMPNRSCE